MGSASAARDDDGEYWMLAAACSTTDRTAIRLERVPILCVDPLAARTRMRRPQPRRAGQHWGSELRQERHPIQTPGRRGLLAGSWKDTPHWIHALHARGPRVYIGEGVLLRGCCMLVGDGRVHCREI